MRTRAVAGAVLAVAVLGCGEAEETDPALGDPPLHPVPGCEEIDPAPCDVRTSPCQQRLFEMAACLRGEEAGTRPPVTVMTEQEFADYLNARIAEEDPPSGPSHYESALTLLGLVEPGAFAPTTTVAEDVKWVWGVYRWVEKDILIIDHGDTFVDEYASPVLVHEFVHALQDRGVDLMELENAHWDTFDSALAVDAVVEGEARMHEARYAASELGVDPLEVDWDEYFQNDVERAETSLDGPSPYTESWHLFPYSWGARYMHFTWEDGGQDAVLERFGSPPETTHTLMASVDHAVEMDFTPAELLDPATSRQWELVGTTTLGAWGLFLFLATTTGDPDAARVQALRWRGDRLGIYARSLEDDATTALVWQIELADAASAVTVGNALASVAETEVFGNRVVAAATDGPLSLGWAFAR